MVPTLGLYISGRLIRGEIRKLKAPTPEPEFAGHLDAKTKRTIERMYNKVIFAHTSFRYCAFWMTTYTHSLASEWTATMNDSEWMKFSVGLTACYVVSIIVLSQIGWP